MEATTIVRQIFDRKIAECETKASSAMKARKYMMYGYWKAIAVHFRKMKRDFLKEMQAAISQKLV